MEVCPQFNVETGLWRGDDCAGEALQRPPHGKVFKEERLRALAGDGGIQECGYAQNCVEVCPRAFR